MKEGVLASAGAQDMDTNGFELSDSEDIHFFWEVPQVELEAVLVGTDTPFSPTTFNDLELGEGGSSKNPIVLDEEEDNKNSPLATNPVP